MKKSKILILVLVSLALIQLNASRVNAKKVDSILNCSVPTNSSLSFPDSSAWILKKIVGVKSKKMTIGNKAFIIINKKEQKLTGYTSCNFIKGTVTFQDSSAIAFNNIAPLKRSCDDATDKIEALFISKIKKSTSWKIVGNMLYLYENENLILEFTEVATPKAN